MTGFLKKRRQLEELTMILSSNEMQWRTAVIMSLEEPGQTFAVSRPTMTSKDMKFHKTITTKRKDNEKKIFEINDYRKLSLKTKMV